MSNRCTPELIEAVRKLVAAGTPLTHACAAHKIPWGTASDWIRLGKQGKEPYAAFEQATREARARWVAGSCANITSAARNDWKASAWMLEKLDRENFGPPRENQQSVQVNVEVARDDRKLAEELAAELNDNPALLSLLEPTLRKLLGGQ